MQQLSGLDASFLYLETENAPMHIGGVSIVGAETPEGPFNLDSLRRLMAERIHTAKPFTQKLVGVPLGLGKPYWVDDEDFDLDNHIFRTQLPKPGGFRELSALASWEFAQPLDRNRPLWELLLVEGVDSVPGVPEGSLALISKVHHAAIDGVSGAQIIQAIFDVKPKIPTADPELAKSKAAAPQTGEPSGPSSTELLQQSGKHLVAAPKTVGKVLGEAVKGAVKSGTKRILERLEPPPMPFTAPRTRFNQPVTKERVWHAAMLSLDRIKALRQSIDGATVNDVVLAICSGALRSYLEEKGDLPKKPLVAMCPISVREKSEDGTMGNKVSAMLVSLSTDLGTPGERLEAIHHSARKSKLYHQAIGARTLSDSSEIIPFGLAGVAARLYTRFEVAKAHRPLFNLVITNVPGPPIPLYVGGAPLLAHMGAGPIFDGMGLILPVFSYAGKLAIGVSCCREIMPDPDLFTALLADSLRQLEAAAQEAKTEVGTSKGVDGDE